MSKAPRAAASVAAHAEEAKLLDRLIDRSKRSSGARLPAAFARLSPGGHTPPLAKLIRGGRGGEVKLRLYLSMVLLAGSGHAHPIFGKHAIFDVSSPTWARILALPDPASRGARRVTDAQNALAAVNLISVERRGGHAPVTRLLHASGSGAEFVEPTVPYIRVPLELWRNRWIWLLSGSELAVLVALIDLCGGKGRNGRGGPQPLSGLDENLYGISPDTWRLASASLTSYGLLHTDAAVVRADLETARRRKRYELDIVALDAPAPGYEEFVATMSSSSTP